MQVEMLLNSSFWPGICAFFCVLCVRLLRVEFAAAAGVFMHRCQQRYHVGLPRGVHGRRKCSGLLRGRDGSLYQISFPSDLVPWGPQPVDSNTGVPIRAAFAGRMFGA